MSDTTQSQASENVAPQAEPKREEIPFRTRVRDRITGFTGVVTGRGQWLDECDTVLAVNEKGESRWIKVHHAEPLDTASAA